MKKFISVTIIISILFSMGLFNSCAKTKMDIVNLSGDKTELIPGETFTIKIHMKEKDQVACFQYELNADDNLIIEKKEQLDVGDFTVLENTDNNIITIAGMVATVYDVSDIDFYSVTYKVPEDAESGKKLKITLKTTQYLIGLDKNGDETQELCDSIPVQEYVVKVK